MNMFSTKTKSKIVQLFKPKPFIAVQICPKRSNLYRTIQNYPDHSTIQIKNYISNCQKNYTTSYSILHLSN